MNKIAQVSIGQEFFRGGITGPISNKLQDLTGIGSLVSLLVQGSVVLAGIILLFYFVVGGIGMIAGAGSNDPQKLEQGKKAVTTALIGFIVVFTAYWIVKLIGQMLKIDLLQNLFP